MGKWIPGTHEIFPVESVQGILGILLYELLSQVQDVVGKNETAYTTILKLDEPKT